MMLKFNQMCDKLTVFHLFEHTINYQINLNFWLFLFIRAPLPASLYANEEQETKTTGEQFGLVNINYSALG